MLDHTSSEHKDIITRINMSMDASGEHQIDKFAKFLNVNREFKGDENIALFQTLKMMDKALMNENNKNFKLKYEKVGLELIDIDGKKIQINARFGEGHFQKDLDHLIKIGCNNCDISTASKVANDMFAKATSIKEPEISNEKDKRWQFEFKNPATPEYFDKIVNGGLKGVVMIAESINDECIKEFATNLYKTARIFGVGNSSFKNPHSIENSTEKSILKSLGLTYKQKLESGEIKLPKEKEKVHSNNKDMSVNR